ncbi:MAG: hypothetical protein IJO08_01665 [Clostridia bacterium]|nr:hypothetical protein [Clostridia bacterium]
MKKRRMFTMIFIVPLLLFLCYYNIGIFQHNQAEQIEAPASDSKNVSWHPMYYLLPDTESMLKQFETKHPILNKKYKPTDKHRYNSARYKTKNMHLKMP